MSETVEVQKLIKKFEDMAKRKTLLTGKDISQEDLLMQIIGTIAIVAMDN